MKKYIVKLSRKERTQLQTITKKGKHGSRVIKRAMTLLKSDAEKEDKEIAHHIGISIRTVQRIRKRYVDNGIEHALYDAPRPGTPPRLNEKQEAILVATACSDPPQGHTYWTIELLREKLINDNVVRSVSVGTIHARLSERGIKPWREKNVVYSEG